MELTNAIRTFAFSIDLDLSNIPLFKEDFEKVTIRGPGGRIKSAYLRPRSHGRAIDEAGNVSSTGLGGTGPRGLCERLSTSDQASLPNRFTRKDISKKTRRKHKNLEGNKKS